MFECRDSYFCRTFSDFLRISFDVFSYSDFSFRIIDFYWLYDWLAPMLSETDEDSSLILCFLVLSLSLEISS